MGKKMSSMNEQQEAALRDGLRALAASVGDVAPRPGIEEAVLGAMGRLTPAFATPSRTGSDRSATGAGFSRPWAGYAAAAALLIASISGAWLAHESARTPRGTIHPRGFVEIPGAAALPPMESASIVRVALPVSVLPQYGLAISPEIAGDSIQADLLVAQDGVARMIRVASDDSTRSTP
jgi:hypothetical protein